MEAVTSKRITYFETAFYLFIWIVTFSIPVITHINVDYKWDFILNEWIRFIPFLVIFLINHFLLIPKLLLKSKFPLYIISCILLLGITAMSYSFYTPPQRVIERRFLNKMERMGERMQAEMDTLNADNPPLFRLDDFSPDKRHLRNLPPRPNIYFNLWIIVIGFLIIGFNSGMRIFTFWMREKSNRDEKERQYLNSELSFLKQQISPHFFMNTLNNIHALIDINSEMAKNAIIRLSKLMRYLLYETDSEFIPLQKEIDFLESYIELIRLRFDERKLTIKLTYPQNVTPVYVPALLFVPLMENTFKHGVRPDKKSFVEFHLTIEGTNLLFHSVNSIHREAKQAIPEASGIGMDNIRKRLELIYNDKYTLDIHTDDHIFEVKLSIPIDLINKDYEAGNSFFGQ